jgi:hypothetical protein
MKAKILSAVAITATLARVTSGVPEVNVAKLQARQSIDFDLVDSAPDPTVLPNDISTTDPEAAIASVIAEVRAGSPLSERRRALDTRDIIVGTYPGYTANILLDNVAINAPLDCNQKVNSFSLTRLLPMHLLMKYQDTYMGVKLFTESAFDTALCAAACS